MIRSGLYCIALACALLLGVSASTARSETIRNSAYRFSLSKPDGWHGVTASEVANPAFHASQASRNAASTTSQALVVGFSKHKEPYAELNATFMMLEARLGPAVHTVPPARVMDSMLASIAKTGGKMAIVSPSRATTVGGLPAAHARFHVDIANGKRAHPAEVELWVIPRGESFLIIQTQAKRDDKSAGMSQLRSSVKSIRFDR